MKMNDINEAEELHKESLEILAKLASSKAEILEEDNVISNFKVSKCLKNAKANCKVCQLEKCNGTCDKENQVMVDQAVQTPQKEKTSSGDPVTPTANLKMLVCAASVLTPAADEIENQKRNLFADNIRRIHINNIPDSVLQNKLEVPSALEPKSKKGQQQQQQLLGRKEKSLGLLCKRFLEIYPEYSSNGTTILLDDVVKLLSIGRRRVYDIVNVLESMEMMVRQAKNKYLWYGKSRLRITLTKLKALALRVYGKNFCNVQSDYKLKKHRSSTASKNDRNPMSILTDPQSDASKSGDSDSATLPDTSHYQPIQPKPPASPQFESDDLEDTDMEYVDDVTSSIMDYIISNESTKKENSRSLGILCQKFIMLFMVAENNVVTLDKAARILLNESDEGPAKYKTKVRRLYDIANILTSIEFLEKTNSYENASKKAAYKWVGLDLKSLDSEDGIKKAFQSLEFSVTRHSLLAQVPKKPSDLALNTRKLQCRSASAQQLTISQPGKFDEAFKAKFPRTYSAVAVSSTGNDIKEDPESDGFDISQIEEGEIVDEEKVKSTGGNESPNQALFKEKLRKLQEEFPDKLPNSDVLFKRLIFEQFEQNLSTAGNSGAKDGKEGQVIHLQTFANNLSTTSQAQPLATTVKVHLATRPNLRRSLSGDFDENALVSPSKKIKLDSQQQQQLQVTKATTTNTPMINGIQAPLTALKPLLSYVASQAAHNVANNQPTNFKISKVPANLITNITAAPKAFQKNLKFDSKQPCRPILVSSSLSLPKSNGGVYQIIPIHCKPLKTLGDKPIRAVPVVLNQHTNPQPAANFTGNSPATSQANNVLTMLVRQPIVTVNSPQVIVSPRNQVFKKQGTEMLSTQQLADKYPEYFTPPHMPNAGKPAANPIIFPKMTPETPSSDPKCTLNAVQRKLMSFQSEEQR